MAHTYLFSPEKVLFYHFPRTVIPADAGIQSKKRLFQGRLLKRPLFIGYYYIPIKKERQGFF